MNIQFIKFGDTNGFVFGKDGSMYIYIYYVYIYMLKIGLKRTKDAEEPLYI